MKLQIVRSNLIMKLKTNEITYVVLCHCDLRYYIWIPNQNHHIWMLGLKISNFKFLDTQNKILCQIKCDYKFKEMWK